MIFSENRYPLFRIMLKPVTPIDRHRGARFRALLPTASALSGMTFLRIVILLYLFV
jgi:hypothetical protein